MNTEPLMVRTLKGKREERIPVWLMRQAGRYLPEYRALREKAGSFLDLCFNPEMASEVTLQPLRRFDLDAAILFSDILVIPYALGQDLAFEAGEGPRLDPVRNASDLRRLQKDRVMEKLAPVMETVRLTRAQLGRDQALIGFAGAPWTVASYMVEGGGGHDFSTIKAFAKNDPAAYAQLVDLLVDSTCDYLEAQVAAGAQILQIFESWAGVVNGPDFDIYVIAPVKRMVDRLKTSCPDIPVIVFPRTADTGDIARLCDSVRMAGVGLSQDVDMAWAAENLPDNICLQGNLDPALLLQGGQTMKESAQAICQKAHSRPYIFNLGHGVIKETPPDHVAELVAAIRAAEICRDDA